ncbi:RNA-directed DNA polymerase [Gossypium australe]|uniref:RNA-directed DNA polymerase n=1 Tax=Gossypium australe TaxID=47621 RepID=A0A5B6UUW4_9ROSI|nr:RNA-directed DNA polymerase [Gossypium australe]
MVHSVLRVMALLDHGRHLGLPSLIGRNKKQVFGFIRDRLCKRMFNWKNKLLLGQVKSTSVFLLLFRICVDLQWLMNSYLWCSNSGNSACLHWASSERLCTA